MKKLLFLLMISLSCLLFAGVASAVTNPQPVNSEAFVTQGAQISGNNIVYQQEYSGTDHDIYKKDLVTGSVTAVTTSNRDDQDADISGDIVVWRSKATGTKWQIYWKNTSTSNPEALVYSNPSVDQFCPRISGTYVIWQQYFGPPTADTGSYSGVPLDDYDIVGYDLATNTYYPSIASSKQYEDAPEIFGNTVVYYKYVNVGTVASPKWRNQVYKTTFGTINQGQRIHANTNDQTGVRVSGSGTSRYLKAAWTEQNETSGIHYIVWVENLWAADPIAHTETNGINDNEIALSDNILVWTRQSSSSWDVVMKDISNSHNFRINVQTNSYDQRTPAVGVSKYGIFVAYVDVIDGYDRVYWRNMDSTLPKTTAGSPARNAVDVTVNKVITTTFSEPIKIGSGTIKLVNSTGTVVPINKWYLDKVLYVIPQTALKKATMYTLILAAGSVTDYAGNPLAAYSRSFTSDITPPKVVAGSPARNAVNVPVTKIITTTFNEPIKLGAGTIKLVTSSGTVVNINKWIDANNVLYVQPLSLLNKATKYTLILAAGSVVDYAGYSNVAYSRSFTTDGTPPKTISGSPSRNAVNVPVDKVIITKFNENIMGANNWITLKPVGGTPVIITPIFSGNALTIYPTFELAPSTKYILEFHTGSITDTAGNPLKYYYRYFTTGTT